MCGFLIEVGGRSGLGSLCARDDVCRLMEHRGPDSVGHEVLAGANWEWRFHFRRLAILDLDARSSQPFGDSKLGTLVYNGEIYNVAEVRKRLLSRGVPLVTSGDTELMFHLLVQPDWRILLGQVDGMYAFALALPSGELRFGRDRLGIKPLYISYAAGGELSGLSSEIEPLRTLGLVGSVDEVAVASAAMFLWVPPPLTGWSRCRSVEPGTVWSVDSSSHAPRLVWRVEDSSGSLGIGEAVARSVARQATADVPVALLLSGGLDSTWLGVELNRQGFAGPFLGARSRLSVPADEPFAEDAPYAQRVAESLGRQILWADLDVDILGQIPEMVTTLEQPFGDPAAIALMRLSTKAAEHAKVLLSGVGVEEVFLGYERYRAIKFLERSRALGGLVGSLAAGDIIPRRFRERGRKFRNLLLVPPRDWVWASQAYYSVEEWSALAPRISLDAVVERHREVAGHPLGAGASILAATAATDRRLFLPGLNLMYADRASMRSSVELRVPFLGEEVLAAAASIDAESHVRLGEGKVAFRRAAERAGVPKYVLARSKSGFGAPIRSVMRARGQKVWAAIDQSELFDGIFDRSVVEGLFRDHVIGKRELGLQLFGLTSLAVWWERFVTGGTDVAERLSDIAALRGSETS